MASVRLALVTAGGLQGESEKGETVAAHEHFQVSLILHNLIFIVIAFVGVAITTFSRPRGPRSKTLCTILCCILVGGGIVGVITTSAGEIKELEARNRDSDQMIFNLMKAVTRQRREVMRRDKEVIHGEEKIKDMNENAQRLLGQLVARGGLSQDDKKKIDAILAISLHSAGMDL